MIEKKEILNLAKSKGLPVSTIEKDYVLGWFLAAIQNHHNLFGSWAFKGGTCLKKCYLDDYRFSEDLDFSLLDSAHLNKEFLRKALVEMADWLYEETGLEIPLDEIKIDIYKNQRNNINAQVKVKFCGPLRPKSKSSWPKVKLDLTADERVVEPPKKLKVFHTYSDEPPERIYIYAYPIEELFAEKMRALSERCRPRDLYDVIMIFQKRTYFNMSAEKCYGILEKKCQYKSISVPNLVAIENHSQKQILESQWSNMLQHQIPNLSTWNVFWKKLSHVFQWLEAFS